ncbi:MAG: PA0069 family radical SAM protein [Blastocatellia bacterium]|nr:PA0069 family radical SAM protein [Blastocatellia bacterium]
MNDGVSHTKPKQLKGRGTADAPKNRFERLHVEPDLDGLGDDEAIAPKTKFVRDASKSIIATNDSPDVGFDASINPYRGCEHGCVYCYARPYHEYLGLNAGIDFETTILVKEDAPRLLRAEMMATRWKPQKLGISGVTDPYQPIERKLEITRRCLEVLAEFRNPVSIVTKNRLVTRDIDILSELARHDAAAVAVSITSLDSALIRKLEPRTSQPELRLDAIARLSDAGIPVVVLIAPIIPALTDHELPAILKAAYEAGARYSGYTVARLPGAVAGLFDGWLEEHYPDRRLKIIHQIENAHGGNVADTRFGKRMKGDGVAIEQIHKLFHVTRRRLGYQESLPHLSTDAFRRPARHGQLELFD